eukprot:5461085-Amphidinium_carterae.1
MGGHGTHKPVSEIFSRRVPCAIATHGTLSATGAKKWASGIARSLQDELQFTFEVGHRAV